MEHRLLLTVWNVNQKFADNGSADGGQAAFGDNATVADATPNIYVPSGYNNNDNNGTTSGTSANDTATPASPWSFGGLDSGYLNNGDASYSFSSYVDPNTFDNYLTGA